MPNYRRIRIEGGTYFFTVVTHNRTPLFNSKEARNWLRSAFALTQNRHPFTIDAICLLPDHIHTVWTLPENDADYSIRWKQIKTSFTKKYLKEIGSEKFVNESQSRNKHGEAAIWQRRFWEHTIQDKQDYYNHLDYIHYNPVKHGLAQSPKEWLFSSFSQYVDNGTYDPDWGNSDDSFLKLKIPGE